MKRVLAVALIGLVLAGAQLFAAGGSEEAVATQDTVEPIWFMINQVKEGFAKTLEEDLIRQYVQEKTGIEYYIEQYAGDDYDTKLQLGFASGDYPDLFVAPGVSAIARFKAQGVIRPLTELFADYGQDMRAIMYEDQIGACKIDGELWALPNGFAKDAPGSGPQAILIALRMDWLEAVGMEPPETIDEFREVLAAFTFLDPDGNGKDDTIGYTFNADHAMHSSVVANAFGIHATHWFERDGEVVYGAMTEEYKDAIAIVADWYDEGIIDPEFPILSQNNVDEKIIAGRAGATWGHVWYVRSNWRIVPPMQENEANAVLQPIYPLVGPNGDRGYPAPTTGLGDPRVISSAISEERAVRIMTLLNWYAQDQNWLVPHVGIPGEHWDWVDTSYGKDIEKKGVATKAATKFAVGIGNPNRLWSVIDRRGQSQELYGYIDMANEYVLSNQFFGVVPAMEEYPDLDTAINETVTRVIIGELPVSALDEMQENWYKNGGREITDQVNEFWKANQ